MMKVLQINLHRSKAASANLTLHLGKDGADVALIQEPWTVNDSICGIRCNGYRTFVLSTPGRPRSCILIKNKLNALLLQNFCDSDTTAISLSLENGLRDIWLVSSYMAHDHTESPPPKCVRDIVTEAKRRNTSVIIGADANAHHTIWASTDINDRGESLFNFITNETLTICNRGEEPTFITSVRKEVLDLTLLLNNDDIIVSNWSVLSDHSFSDHRYLQFHIEREPSKKETFKNYRKTDWDYYRRRLGERLGNRPNVPTDELELEELVGKFTVACRTALEESCKSTSFSVTKKGSKPYWWNAELEDLKSSVRRLFNMASKNDNQRDWDIYKVSLSLYKNEIRKAKQMTWRIFCETIEGINQAARLRCVLSKEKSPCAGSLMKEDGTWTLSSEESLEILMDTHFPKDDRNACHPPEESGGNPPSLNNLRSIVNMKNLVWAIRGFKPYKSAGPDGIIPAQLQEALHLSCSWLGVIFRGCLMLGVIPDVWKQTKVVFIPKAGKCSHVKPKDFRPISLSSFVLKTFERLLDIHIRSNLPRNLLSSSQHAYMKGRSTETALYSIVEELENSLEKKVFALGTFLDIEGAFNNILPAAILRSLRDLGVDNLVTRLIGKLLVDRTVKAEWGVSQLQGTLTEGHRKGEFCLHCYG